MGDCGFGNPSIEILRGSFVKLNHKTKGLIATFFNHQKPKSNRNTDIKLRYLLHRFVFCVFFNPVINGHSLNGTFIPVLHVILS